MVDPRHSFGKQSILREQYRVEELLFNREHDQFIALLQVLPEILRRQDRFLRTARTPDIDEISIQDLAGTAKIQPSRLAVALDGMCVQVQERVIPFDELVGPRLRTTGSLRTGLLDPKSLVPTDFPRDRRAFEDYVHIFKCGRQRVLDPVLVIADPLDPSTGFVCSGNHRAGAAASLSRKVTVRLLETQEHLSKYVIDGEAARFARSGSMNRFAEECAARADRLGYKQYGWKAYLEDAGHPG